MPTYNALDLISRSLRETGYLSGTAAPNAQDGQQGFETLNGMIDSWKIDTDFIYCREFPIYTLTSGQQSYTIGPDSANFSAVRPNCILNANIIDANNVRVSHLAIIDDDSKMGITVTQVGPALPGYLNYKRGMQNGTLTFYPIPSSGLRVELEIWVDLPEFPDLTTDAEFPPGMYDALVYGLAKRFSTPGWGAGPSKEINDLFYEAKQRLIGLNQSPTPQLSIDPRSLGVRRVANLGVPSTFIDGAYISGMYRGN